MLRNMMTVHVTAQVAHKTIVQQVTTIIKQVVTMVHILINVPIKNNKDAGWCTIRP